ncbi:MAG: zinc-dependent metalloprotease [Candidatus Cryptobacteroides sp.]
MKKCLLIWILVISVTLAGRADSLMRLSLDDGRLIADIPESMIGRKLLFASIIEATSDPGEGVSGQMSDNCLPLMFVVNGEWLDIKFLCAPYPDTEEIDAPVQADFLRYKIMPGAASNAVKVDLTEFFKDQFSQLYMFPKNSYNSQGGTVMRTHSLIPDQSALVSTEVSDSIASVRCDFSYKMEGYAYGFMKFAGDYSVRVMARKMFFLPAAESELSPLEESPFVGSACVGRTILNQAGGPVRRKSLVSRYRIPERPLVFYVDSLVPDSWKPYVVEGVEAWNRAFESAGLGRTLEALPMTSESLRYSPYCSRIIYATSGMHSVEALTLTDPLSGERISSTICIHDDVIAEYASELKRATAASWPDVRQRNLPDSVTGSIVRLLVMQAVGKCLGLTANYAASSEYPVDSLRSPTFTAKYGLTASVMEAPVFNYIARPQDSGVKYIQDVVGPYDMYAIGRIYGGIDDAPGKYCGYFNSRFAGGPVNDPFVAKGDLGNNHFKAMEYCSENLKDLFSNALDWFAAEGEDYSEVESILKGAADDYAVRIVHLLGYVGGFRSCLSQDGRPVASRKPLPAEMQSRAVSEVIARLRDMDWLDAAGRGTVQYGTVEFIGDVYRTNIFNSLLNRFEDVSGACRNEGSDYTVGMFLRDIKDAVFGESTLRTGLESYEMVWQTAFVEMLAGKTGDCFSVLNEIKRLVASKPVKMKGDRSHYEYLSYRLDKLCEK